jgi:hypothetical protein
MEHLLKQFAAEVKWWYNSRQSNTKAWKHTKDLTVNGSANVTRRSLLACDSKKASFFRARKNITACKETNITTGVDSCKGSWIFSSAFLCNIFFYQKHSSKVPWKELFYIQLFLAHMNNYISQLWTFFINSWPVNHFYFTNCTKKIIQWCSGAQRRTGARALRRVAILQPKILMCTE